MKHDTKADDASQAGSKNSRNQDSARTSRETSSSHKPGVVKDGETRHAPLDPDHYKPASPAPGAGKKTDR